MQVTNHVWAKQAEKPELQMSRTRGVQGVWALPCLNEISKLTELQVNCFYLLDFFDRRKQKMKRDHKYLKNFI